MLIPEYALQDFIRTVPICVQTSPLALVLEIFNQGECDHLVVVNERQNPIGVVKLRRLMPQVISSYGCEVSLDLQQPLWAIGVTFVEPIAILPAELSAEQFRLYLRSEQFQPNTDVDWALVDSDGKFIGLLDHVRLLQFLALSPATVMGKDESEREVTSVNENYVARLVLDSLVQLLERMPLPLMLQTGTGEVVTQNPAWRQQFGTLSDPEAIKKEVEALLDSVTPQVEVKTQESEVKINEFYHSGILEANIVHASLTQESQQRRYLNEAQLNHLSSPSLQKGLSSEHFTKRSGEYILHSEVSLSNWSQADTPPPVSNTVMPASTESDNSASSSSRCQLSTQPNTCICAWSGQNEQERVWQFVRIPFTPDLWLLLATDVTEQQQLASELAAKNTDLIQLNRLKDEFLACISHELKTPITAVMGLSTLLKDQALGQLNERQARYAKLIHQSGRHLMSVVNDILDLTRMETGQLMLTLEPVQIKTVCDRALEQARAMQPKTRQSLTEPLGAATDPRFTLLIEPGLDILVADELRLRQMLVHLLANAFKFTAADGEIGLRVSHWEGWIAFTVWDTGIGIPEQQQHLIFQKFQQLENPLTRQFEGTGLGLVLTRALARLHGGDVSFLSKEGKGSSFTLLLPPSPPDKRAGERGAMCRVPIPTLQNHRSRLVLIVEAAPRFIENLTEHLTNLGYRFVIARSGTEALEKARRLQPEAVFLNPLLPLLSGWDVLTLLKSDAATSKIPVIVTATLAEKDQAVSNRADEFLNLPVQQLALQQILARFCAIPPSHSSKSFSPSASDTSLTVLRLVNTDASRLTSHSSLLNHRVLEADDLEQAELLARVWQPDVVLLDRAIPEPIAYLKQFSQHPTLKDLPLVTLNAATTRAANEVTGLSVFPCLTPIEIDADALLPVLQIAAGISWKPSVLVVDVATLPDLQDVRGEQSEKHSSLSLGSEWFQALIQYLETAGFTGVMGHSWAEVLQQIRLQSIDLVLICLADSRLHSDALAALKVLDQQPHLPPVLVLDQRLSQGEVREHHHSQEGNESEFNPTADVSVSKSVAVASPCSSTMLPKRASAEQFSPGTAESDAGELESVLGAMCDDNPLLCEKLTSGRLRVYATQILPPSLSIAELLNHI